MAMSDGEFSTNAEESLRNDSLPTGDAGERDGADSSPPVEGAGTDKEKIVEEVRTLGPEELLELKRNADDRDLYLAELLRVKADLDNYQKRVRRERPNWEDHAVRRLLSEILPVVDNFQLALNSAVDGESTSESLLKGIELIYQLLEKTFEDNGVEEIKALDEMFDPKFHEAVVEVGVKGRKTGEVVAVEQKGYLYKGVVIRPSRVRVAKNIEGDEKRASSDDLTEDGEL